jgi:acetoacetate decarboxylase
MASMELGEGHIWTDALVLVADIDVDVDTARGLLPPTLELADPPRATVFVADYPATAFGSVYREAAVLLHASDDRGGLRHCPWMVVDDDTALIIGREMLGFPKKLADIDLSVTGDRAVGTVSRHGTQVLRIEVDLTGDEPDPGPVFSRRFVNACGTMVHGLDLLEIPPSDEVIHRSRTGSGTVRLADGPRDLLGQLAGSSEVTARLVHLDFGGGAEPARVLRPADADWTAGRMLGRVL